MRFGLGTAGALALGYAAFRETLFRPEHAAFQCVTVGMLAAGVLTLVRLSLRVQALALAFGFGALQFGVADRGRWAAGLGGLLIGLGLFVVAEIFDELARHGYRFGKFLLVGPLLGGVLIAVAPIAVFHELILFDAVRPLLLQLFMGVVVGDGVGLGIELAELVSGDGLAAGDAVAQTEPSVRDRVWKSRQRTY